MKIQEFATSKNLSNNAIYKAIRREGYSAKELTDKRGNITPAGFRILRRIYPEDTEAQQKNLEQLKETEKESDLLGLEKEIANLREQLAENKERAEKWERLYLELQEQTAQERSEIQQQLKASQILLAQQQEINSRLIMNPIKRLFSGRKSEKAK